MKRTPQDDLFALEFGRQLRLRYEESVRSAAADRISEEQFATNLGVTRPALRKYLSGKAMPTVRTVVFAFLKYGVSVPYFGTLLFGKRRARNAESPNAQLVLPFSVRGLGRSSVHAKIEPTGTNQFEIRVDVSRAV